MNGDRSVQLRFLGLFFQMNAIKLSINNECKIKFWIDLMNAPADKFVTH